MSATHAACSAWSGCDGSAKASIISSYPGKPPASSGGPRRAPAGNQLEPVKPAVTSRIRRTLRPSPGRVADPTGRPLQACRPVLHSAVLEATAGLPEIRRRPAAAERMGRLLQTCAGARPPDQMLSAGPDAPDSKPGRPGARTYAKSQACRRSAPRDLRPLSAHNARPGRYLLAAGSKTRQAHVSRPQTRMVSPDHETIIISQMRNSS